MINNLECFVELLKGARIPKDIIRRKGDTEPDILPVGGQIFPDPGRNFLRRLTRDYVQERKGKITPRLHSHRRVWTERGYEGSDGKLFVPRHILLESRLGKPCFDGNGEIDCNDFFPATARQWASLQKINTGFEQSTIGSITGFQLPQGQFV